MLIFCLAVGFAISYASATVQQLTDHWISGAVAQTILVGALMAVLVFAMVHGLLRLMGEQVLQHVSGPDALRLMSARSLELLAAALFEAQGLKVRMRAVPGEPDGGTDLEILRNGKRGLVQIKKWTHENVGVDKMREFYGVMTATAADFGVFVTTSQFSLDAEKFAADKPIELINHASLWEMVQAQRMEARVENAAHRVQYRNREKPVCPQCDSPLVLRLSSHGPMLGCKSYGKTGCSVIIPLETAENWNVKTVKEARNGSVA